MPDWIVYPHEQGLSPLELLRIRLPLAPAAYLRQLLRKDKVTRDGQPLSGSESLAPGERLRLPDSRRLAELQDQAGNAPVRLLWEDDLVIALDKPAGLAVHRGQGHEADNLLQRVERLLGLRGEKARPAPVHRLDRDTSGVVLFAKSREAASHFGKLFMAGAATKTYLALASGEIEGAGRISAVVPAKGKLKEAATGYQVRGAGGGCCLVELTLETGRTHQIRRHLAAAGHPLIGDRRYGGRPLFDQEGYLLHCGRLRFNHPVTALPRTIVAPLPESFSRMLRQLGLPGPGDRWYS